MRFAVTLAVRLLRSSRLLVALLAAFAATRALAQVAVLGTSASTTESSGSASSKAMSFTVPAGSNRLLVVTSTGGGNGVNAPSVTFNGSTMTQAVVASSGFGERTGIWYLALGSSGSGTTANVVVTYNNNYLFNITATAFSGVDQSTPVSGATSGVSSTLNVASASGDMVIDAIGGGGSGIGVGADQTLQASNDGIVFGDVDARVSTEPGAASVTMSWSGYSYVSVHAGVNLRQAVTVPTITSATYDASTGALAVTAASMTTGDTIAVSKLTLTGEGGSTYTLTSANVTASSATAFSVTLNVTDRAAVNLILNRNGTASTSGTTFNLAGADDWNANVTSGDSADTTNGVTVSNVAVPTVTSATYDASTGVLVVTGNGLLKLSGSTNDITVSKLTLTGEGGGTYTLTSAGVELTNGTEFTVALNVTDKAGVNLLLNKNGTSSVGGTTYNLAAAEDWAAGADATVMVADLTGNGVTVSNADSTPPTVTGVTSSSANGTYKAGDAIAIQVSFSENVTVTGTPQLTLETGTTDQVINYGSGSGTSTLTFTYTVQAGDTSADLDYVSTNALALNGGTIKDAANNDATLTLATPGAANSLGANKAIAIDTTAPAAPSTPNLTAGSDTGVSSSDNITSDTTPTFAGTAEAGSDVTLFDTDGTTVLGTTTTDGFGNWSITSSMLSTGSHTITAKAMDAVGNVSSASSGLSVTIDATAPVAPSAPDLTAGTDTGASSTDNITGNTTPTFTGTAEAGSVVTLFDTDGMTPLGSATADGSGNWSITSSLVLTGGSHTVTAKATDVAGNGSPASSGLDLTIDVTAPVVSSVSSSTANGTYKAGDAIAIQVNFGESVAVTGTPQLTLETGTTDQVINYASGSGTSTLTFTYTVQAGDTSLDLDYVSTGALGLNGGTVQDLAGNDATLTLASPGAANSLGANKALVIDTSAPSVSGVTASTANGAYKAGDAIAIQVSFSENVTVTGTPQLTLETGTTDQVINYASGSGTSTLTFTYTVHAGDTSSDLDYGSTGALGLNGGTIKDGAGNNATLTLAAPGAANSLGASKALVIDTTAPVVSSVVRHTPATATVTSSSVVFRATFSEPVTGVDLADFTATVTGISASVASVSPISASIYDVTVNGLAGVGTLRLDVASGGLADDAGNTLSAAFSAGEVYAVDTSVQFPIVANFDGADNNSLTSAGWLLAGDTTATGDRLRLTRAVNALAGTAIFNQAFAAAVGVNVQFDYEMSGGTGADGLAFFLVDGAQATPTSGGTGPSFGYVYSSTVPGASLGYLGVGFDLWGNFTSSTSFHDGVSAVENPNRIALRGPATIASSGAAHDEYDYVVGSAVNYSVAGTRKVNLTITPTGRITLQVSADAGATWTSIYNDFDFAATAAFSGYTQPATLKLGFGASTGGSNNLHAIDNVVVRKPAEHAIAFTTTPSGTQDVGATVSYTLTATNNGWNDDPAVQLAYTVPAALADVTWSYSVDGGTAITGTSSTISETFALAAGKSAVLTVQGRITAGAAGTTLAHSATLTPSSAFGDLEPTNNIATASTAVRATPAITSALTASATYGTVFGGYTITATNTPTSFAATGLPTGLTLNTTTGVISGTPAQSGTFNVSLTGANGGGTGAASTLVLTVAKAALTVTADSTSRGYGSANPAFTVSYSGFVNGDTSASLDTAPTATTTANASSGTGTYPITAAGGVSANYTFTYVDGVLTVNRASALITLSNLNASYTGAPQAVSVTTFPSGLTVAVTYDGSGVAPSAPGSYGVVATVDDSHYQGSGSGILTIGRIPVAISVAALATTYDGQPKPVGVTTTPTGLTATVTYNGSTAVPTQAGTYSVVAAVDTSTHAGTASGTLTIGKAAQTIAFGELASRDANADPFALSATASSGLPVTFAVTSGPALLSGNTVTLTGVAGPVTITATQDGDANHLPAPGVTRTFTVNAAGARVFIGAVTTGVTRTLAGDIGAVLPPTGNTGHMVIVAPGENVQLAFDFVLRPDGTFERVIVDDGAPKSLAELGRAVAAAPRTLTLRGRLDGNVLAGRFDEIDLAFEIGVQSRGATTAAAGYYTSTTINSAAGSTYTIVGHHGEVITLSEVGETTLAGRTTLNADGSFNLASGTAALSGAIDVSTTTVTGTLSRSGLPDASFAGAAVTTLRTDRMVNLSSRARIGPAGERTLITGFVIGGTASKRVLLRAVGPALAGYGVGGALNNPRLQLFDSSRGLILENDDWSGADTAATFAATGAFALPPGTRDAAIVVTLAPGAYTMHVIDGGDTGVALAEIYDAGSNPSAEYQRLINISSRGTVDSGEGALIGGFVITGNLPKRVLVRGVGPSLASHGVTDALSNPQLSVFAGATPVAQNDDWGMPQALTASQIAATAADITAAGQVTGAFALLAGSRDAAVVVTLAPGAYTAQVTSADGSAGIALVEVYELPE